MTLDELDIPTKLKIRLAPQAEKINMILKFHPRYSVTPPTRGTLYAWARGDSDVMGDRKAPPKGGKSQNLSEDERSVLRKANRERYKKSWTWTAWRRLKRRASLLGLEFNIDPSDLQPPEFCPVLGIRLSIGGGVDYETRKSSPSGDRFDTSIGDVKGNVRVISHRANSLKTDATAEEIRLLSRYMQGE